MFRLPPFWWSMLPAWKLIELQRAWKKGCSPVYRTNKRRIELRLRVTCKLWCRRMSDSGIAGGWLCLWLCRSSIFAADLAPVPAVPADRGYAAGIRTALWSRGNTPCISYRDGSRKLGCYDKKVYQKRHWIENSLARLKDWRHIAMRYNRCRIHFFRQVPSLPLLSFVFNESFP